MIGLVSATISIIYSSPLKKIIIGLVSATLEKTYYFSPNKTGLVSATLADDPSVSAL